ncbi:MAG: hypothetical protein OQJ89_01680 [Kangiellaceae bacterium]|nr:hypothetical protein [Kangiellaceae bacterium]MCW8997348.1 hypothetical protein [Kangiellaceae bacterium]MCW9015653.1 hypothetical protein [Kangiellaceae bacterium]
MSQSNLSSRYRLGYLKELCLLTSLLLLFVMGLLNKANAYADKSNPLGSFKSLIGEWSIKDFSLSKEGKWQPAGGADWNFYPILNGAAIQDDWISPAMDKPAPKSGRQLGTNIRIFNQKTNEWQMAWIANTGQKVETFKAIELDGKIVMLGKYQGNDTRITFFDITESTFSWTMEVSSKSGSDEKVQPSWKVVYKIEASKKRKGS